jgi:HEPN domain-containing protein
MSDPDDWRTWLEKAGNDLLNIGNNLNSEKVPWDTVCFHAQQAAEKLLKALLVSRGEIVPRTHDLSALLGLCTAAGVDVHHLSEDCEHLQPFAVLTRYPGTPFEPDEEEGLMASESARRIEQAIVRLLEENDDKDSS